MDLLELVRTKVESLPEGPSQVGLRSVFRHIEAAYRHLSRGLKEGDETAFTDAIFRSNQAFEGSIKEAYRVLAEKDPHETTPYQIEQYLQENNLFRDRVLSLFRNYRMDWRNPSTHDYNLVFDEDEAFLAIISVSAFSKMLIDQIDERLAFISARDDVSSKDKLGVFPGKNNRLIDDMEQIFLRFLAKYALKNLPFSSEKLIGALRGFLSPDSSLDIVTNHRLMLNQSGRDLEIDMIASRGEESVIIELKHVPPQKELRTEIRYRIEQILHLSSFNSGILLLYGKTAGVYEVETHSLPGSKWLKVIAPTP